MKIDFEKQAEIFKALGHPTRLKLAYILEDGPKCVCELNEFVDVEQPTLSRHLKVLKDAGVCTSKKVGMQVIYSLKVPCLLHNVLECIANV